MKEYIVYENSWKRLSSFPKNVSVYEALEDDPRSLAIPVDYFGYFSVRVEAVGSVAARELGIELIQSAKAGEINFITTTFDVAAYREMLDQNDTYIALIHSPRGPVNRFVEINDAFHFDEVYRFDRNFPDTAMLMQFFRNGGSKVSVCRIPGIGAKTAWVDFGPEKGCVFASSCGAWGNELSLDVRCSKPPSEGSDIKIIDISLVTTEIFFNVNGNPRSTNWFADYINNRSKLAVFSVEGNKIIDDLSYIDGSTFQGGDDGRLDWVSVGDRIHGTSYGTGLYSFINSNRYANIYLIVSQSLDKKSWLMSEIMTWASENRVTLVGGE